MKILVVLKRPTGRQKRKPMPVAAAVMSVWKGPLMYREMKARIGAARTRPAPHAIDVHSKEEKVEPLTDMVRSVSVLYLQQFMQTFVLM